MTIPIDDREARARRLVEELSRGNPLLDPAAYDEAVRQGGASARDLIESIKEAAHANLDALIDGIIKDSTPPDVGSSQP